MVSLYVSTASVLLLFSKMLCTFTHNTNCSKQYYIRYLHIKCISLLGIDILYAVDDVFYHHSNQQIVMTTLMSLT